MSGSGPVVARVDAAEQPFEHRAALTPTTARKLMDAGFAVTVERDPQRIFDDSEYEKSAFALQSTVE